MDELPANRCGEEVLRRKSILVDLHVVADELVLVAEVCAEFALRAGEVRGVARGRRIALSFSSGFPPVARQRLRNWWAMSGWSAKPGRP